MMFGKKFTHLIVIVTMSVTAIFALGTKSLIAQGNEITLTGVVESLSLNTLTINGLTVNLSNVTLDDAQASSITIGVPVTVVGQLENGVVVASELMIVSDEAISTPIPTVVPSDEATEEVISTAEVTAEATEEVVATAEPTEEPTNENTTRVFVSGTPIIVIEGPVQAINVNVITIYDINIQVANNDPILTQIDIDDIIRVEGEASDLNGTIILVAVNITIVQPFVFVVDNWNAGYAVPAGCKVSKKGKLKCTGRVQVSDGYALPPGCKITKKGKVKCS